MPGAKRNTSIVFQAEENGGFVKLKSLCQWVLGSMALIAAASATSYASGGATAPVPEADPTVLIAVGVLSVGYLAGISRFSRKK
jgi:hypothetical protein